MYSQTNFFYGGINTDDEDRLIPNTDFRDAFYSRNYGINTSDEGALQSMTGNLLRTNSNLPIGINIVIGACEDTEGKNADTSGNLILFVYNDLDYHTIWRYSTQDLSYEKILESSILNFHLSNPIYHASVVNDLLYWTDNYFKNYENNNFNPPRKINIEKAMLYTQSGGTDPEGYSEITFDNLDWIKHPPLFSPDPVYFTDTAETANNLKNKLFQFRYQYIYDDNEESAWSPISIMPLPPSGEYISQTVNIDPFVDNTIKLDITTGSSIARLIRVAYRIGNTGEFFLYKEYDKKELGWADYESQIINFRNETSGPAISNSERNYDLIPQVAKAIEYLPSNEFAIANYIEGYDKIEINEGDFQFTIDRYAIENTAFTYPICEYYLIYNTSAPTTGNHISLISFAGVDNIFKYRYEPGDILIFQFRIYTSSYVNNQVTPTATIFYTVPAIDPILYDTDDLKNTALCNDFISFLTTQGIGCTLVPSGTYSYNGLSINHDAVGLNNQIWFDLTEAQIAASNTSSLKKDIIVLRENKSTRTFKTGATHEFAIQYYDRANRDGTVITIPVGSVYNPFNTDLTNNQLNTPIGFDKQPYYTNMSLEIFDGFQPPIWATNYQIVYKPSTNIANFQQRSIKRIEYLPDSSINLVLDNYYKNENGQFPGASINQTPSKGDLVRFVRERATFNSEFTSALIAGHEGTVSVPASQVDFNSVNPADVYFAYFLGENTVSFPPLATVYTENNISEIFTDGLSIAPTSSQGNITALQSGEFAINLSFDATIKNDGGADLNDVYLEFFYSINGGAGVQFTDYHFEDLGNSGTLFSLNYTNIISLISGDIVTFYVKFQYDDPLAILVSVSLDFTRININGFLTQANYDISHYYPNYVTQEDNLIQELNVLAYDPAGGPNGEEVITVNYFDASLIGRYLVYQGANPNRQIVSGGFQVEIYTPKKQNENDPWFETGIEFPVLNPHTSDRVHAGDTNQVLNTTSAIVNLDCGDVYIRQRVMSTGYEYEGDLEDIYYANDTRAAWFCEDPHYSDYYISNWNNKGRVALYSPFAKRQHLKSSVYHTNSFIDNTQINGLSRVEFFNNVSLKEEQGGINKLVQIGDILKAFQDRKITSLYIQKAFALNGDGTNNVILSDKTFGGVRPHDDDYGSIHAGSISRVENTVFFYDYYNSAFCVVTSGGIVNICENDKKFSKGVRDLTGRINDIYGGYNNVNIWSHINRNNNEYTFYVSENISGGLPERYELPVVRFAAPNLIFLSGNYTGSFDPGTQIFIEGSPNTQNNGTFFTGSDRYLPESDETEIQIPIIPEFATEICIEDTVTLYWYGAFAEASGEAVSYSYERNRWITRLDHGVAFATQLGSRAYSTGGGNIFNFGELFEENYGSELTFLGISRTQQLNFIFNDNPTVVKRFYTHLQQANYPFNVSVSVPANQTYPLGMASDIPVAVLKNQEGYYVSRYFRDLSDPAFTSPLEARINGRELRGYVLRHLLTNSDTSIKKILMNVGVNFASSEPVIQ
tara:strand:- start:18928 stop:23463 length:4536 start_codon:yes stop_codon:yes gene_type:complete